jgi:hypothetical protein
VENFQPVEAVIKEDTSAGGADCRSMYTANVQLKYERFKKHSNQDIISKACVPKATI